MNATDYQTRLALAYAPSSFQAAIFYWIEHGRGHGVVEAVAGSGKTTTIVSAARLISGSGLFVAFNKSIANLLAEKLRGTAMAASTIHSHGFACVRSNVRGRVRVDGRKYRNMIDGAADAIEHRLSLCGKPLTAEQRKVIEDDGFPARVCERLLNLARLSLIDMDAEGFADDLLDLAERHDLLDFDACLEELVCTVVQECMWRGCEDVSTIDFTDMVWLPTVCGWTPKRYAWLFVDECQDLSAAARELLRKSLMPGGRALFVGDRRQAIYGFAGADAASFQAIIDETKAQILPLSICYRCPTAVLDVAREWCPQIEARPNAPTGVVRQVKREDYTAEAKEGDLVLCRRNAPLISLCFELIADGVPAVVRGRDIAAGLVKIVKKVAKRGPFAEFSRGLDDWADSATEVAKRTIRDEDYLAEKLDQICDKAKAIGVIFGRSRAKSFGELIAAIEELFSDERGSVTLSSIHKAKGLEAERVGILDVEGLRNPRRGKPWQLEQEANLAYVAYTRAMSEIIEIED